MKDKPITVEDKNGMHHLTSAGHALLMRALFRSTKFLYFCKREGEKP